MWYLYGITVKIIPEVLLIPYGVIVSAVVTTSGTILADAECGLTADTDTDTLAWYLKYDILASVYCGLLAAPSRSQWLALSRGRDSGLFSRSPRHKAGA